MNIINRYAKRWMTLKEIFIMMKNKILTSKQALERSYPYYEMNIENTRYTNELEQQIDEEWASANIKSWVYMCGDKVYAGKKRDLEQIGSVLRSIFSIEELKKKRKYEELEHLNYGKAKENPYFNVF
jgi:hypothetical protein